MAKGRGKPAAAPKPAREAHSRKELEFSDSGDELDAFKKQQDKIGLDVSDDQDFDDSERDEAVYGLSSGDDEGESDEISGDSDLDDDIDQGGQIAQRTCLQALAQ